MFVFQRDIVYDWYFAILRTSSANVDDIIIMTVVRAGGPRRAAAGRRDTNRQTWILQTNRYESECVSYDACLSR